jgi:hypothetical protein
MPAKEKKNIDKIKPNKTCELPINDKSHNKINFSLFNFL